MGVSHLRRLRCGVPDPSWVTRQPVMVPQDITVLRNAEGPLDRNELVTIDAWWPAANYLAVGLDLSVG
jgi:hypothetical protein